MPTDADLKNRLRLLEARETEVLHLLSQLCGVLGWEMFPLDRSKYVKEPKKAPSMRPAIDQSVRKYLENMPESSPEYVRMLLTQLLEEFENLKRAKQKDEDVIGRAWVWACQNGDLLEEDRRALGVILGTLWPSRT